MALLNLIISLQMVLLYFSTEPADGTVVLYLYAEPSDGIAVLTN
jgi:hypothetical protein